MILQFDIRDKMKKKVVQICLYKYIINYKKLSYIYQL